MLAIGHVRLDEASRALAVLREASFRYPEWESFRLYRARIALSEATSRRDKGIEHATLLRSAVEDALEARDRIRQWDGPSGQAVAIAAEALSLLNEFIDVCRVAGSSPYGEATREEARHPQVVKFLADALLLLNHPDRLDELDVDLLDSRERAHFVAQRAYRRGDPNAKTLMERALEEATDDGMRLKAHAALALFGELDEAALDGISAAGKDQKDLIRASSHYNRKEYETAASFLAPYYQKSSIHAEALAWVQFDDGATDEAVETLTTAAENLGATYLYALAVEFRRRQEAFGKAETLAQSALAYDLPTITEREIRFVLVDIANRTDNYQVMESRARALFERFPSAPLAPWAVIQALVCQVRLDDAWDFLIENDISPIDEQTALVAIRVYSAVSSSDVVAQRLLDTASEFAESEEVAGAALMVLLTIGDEVLLTDTQLSRFRSLLDNYVERFPESETIRAFKSDALEELIRNTESVEIAQVVMVTEAVNRARNGQIPYGLLTAIHPRPYAELLLSLVAGFLTAVSTDDSQREAERIAARNAMNCDVSVDTSVAVLGIRSGLEMHGLTSFFARTLVANELVYDARAAEFCASLPVSGYLSHSSAPGGARFIEVTDEQREQMRDEAGRLVKILQGWHNVPTSRLTSPLDIDDERSRPWDAPLRIAADRQCALWCDDLALRVLAESIGIPAFGTFALWEVLAGEGKAADWPKGIELKARLLRAGIADLPLTWDELAAIVEADDGSDLAAIRFLDRPLSWGNPQKSLEWYEHRIARLASNPDHDRLLQVVRAGCCGRGMASISAERQEAVGEVLAATLSRVRLHAPDEVERTPGILEACRYACRQVDPSGDLDALHDAASRLHRQLVSGFGPVQASAILRRLFSEADQTDRNIVIDVILGS